MDKYNNYLFCILSYRELGNKPILNFSTYSVKVLSFYVVFCRQHHPRVYHCTVYILKLTLKKENAHIHVYSYFSKSKLICKIKISMQSVPIPTLQMVLKSQLFWKKLGDDVILDQYSVNIDILSSHSTLESQPKPYLVPLP